MDRRKVAVHTSVILYAAPIWSVYTDKACLACPGMVRSQRKVLLRVVSAYPTVSAIALLMITGTVPLHLQAIERSEVYREYGRRQCREAAR